MYINPAPSINTIKPTIGKKKNTVINGKSTGKPKKFVPPTKSLMHKQEQKKQVCIVNYQEASHTNTLKGNASNDITIENTNSTKAYQTINNDLTEYGQSQCTQERSLIQFDDNCKDNFLNLSTFTSNLDENLASFDYLPMNSEIGNTLHNTVTPNVDSERRLKTKNIKKDSNIAGVIFGSLNVLNDDEFLLPQNLSQETQSDQSSVKDLSHMQSFSSVTTLEKTYKNLDVTSFENYKDEKIPESSKYKIPEGGEYLKLFKNKTKKKKCRKYPPMSIEFGDMGFNKRYCDYIKEVGFVPEEIQSEEKSTFMKILKMYPKENEILIKMKFPK